MNLSDFRPKPPTHRVTFIASNGDEVIVFVRARTRDGAVAAGEREARRGYLGVHFNDPEPAEIRLDTVTEIAR